MYPTIIPLNTRICIDVRLKEKLRCEYLTTEHERRADFPPDMVLKDQSPPDLIIRDEITGQMWELSFGEEIVVTPYPYAVWWVNGIRVNDGWNIRMRSGEMVVSTQPLAEPTVHNVRSDPTWVFEVVQGELVYRPLPPFSVIMRDLGVSETWWRVAFGPEITAEAMTVPPEEIPKGEVTGIKLNEGYEWQMWNGEIIATQDVSLGPHLWNTQQEWVDLRIVNGESVYRYRQPYVFGQDQFDIAWALYFREEITVVPWPYVTPINGWVITEPWILRMKGGEIVMATTPVPIPFWQRQPERWWFTFYVDSNGELHYEPAPKV